MTIAQVSQVLGSLGAIIVAVGHLPQVVHIAREDARPG